MASGDGYGAFAGRLAHVFLDYTYRDLSIEANRRLFITADRKPAEGLEELNPILYLPLTDPTQPGKNLGTGGDFALTGVVARSGRGPNQFNAPYSELDGAADYIRGVINTSAGKLYTISYSQLIKTNNSWGFVAQNSDNTRALTVLINAASKQIDVGFRNGSGVVPAYFYGASPFIALGRNVQVTICVDLNDQSKTMVFVNGVKVTLTFSSWTNGFGSTYYVQIGRDQSAALVSQAIGNVFFDTRYIDLSQPDNLAKFVTGTGIDAKPVDLGANGEKPFGTPPLIYLPMYGNNAGKNYGTGGDFTVNSGPFPGARGPNEYWGNKADFNGTTGYLARASALAGVSSSKTFSFAFWMSKDTTNATRVFSISPGGGSVARLRVQTGTGAPTSLTIAATDDSDAELLSAQTTATAFSAGVGMWVFASVDLSGPAKRSIYFDNAPASTTWSAYTNAEIPLSGDDVFIGRTNAGSLYLDGKLSEFYFTTDYIDFSQEANRLKFRDAFGNPVALLPQIEAGEIPNPAIYMRFDPANFGKNHGTGGDFTVNGTITDGGQL